MSGNRLLPIAAMLIALSACNRWPVKIGADWDAGKVSLAIVPATVAELAAIPAPRNPGERPLTRFQPTELRTYRVTATLRRVSRGLRDGDYHLILGDGATTMITESPHPAWALVSRFGDRLHAARAAIDRLCPDDSCVGKKVTVTGVGFFDTPHANDRAPNAIELHPILAFEAR